MRHVIAAMLGLMLTNPATAKPAPVRPHVSDERLQEICSAEVDGAIAGRPLEMDDLAKRFAHANPETFSDQAADIRQNGRQSKSLQAFLKQSDWLDRRAAEGLPNDAKFFRKNIAEIKAQLANQPGPPYNYENKWRLCVNEAFLANLEGRLQRDGKR